MKHLDNRLPLIAHNGQKVFGIVEHSHMTEDALIQCMRITLTSSSVKGTSWCVLNLNGHSSCRKVM